MKRKASLICVSDTSVWDYVNLSVYTLPIYKHTCQKGGSSNISIGLKHPVKLTFVFLAYFPFLRKI